MSDQNRRQNDIFSGLGSRGRAGSRGTNTGPSRGTDFDSTPGAGRGDRPQRRFRDLERLRSQRAEREAVKAFTVELRAALASWGNW